MCEFDYPTAQTRQRPLGRSHRRLPISCFFSDGRTYDHPGRFGPGGKIAGTRSTFCPIEIAGGLVRVENQVLPGPKGQERNALSCFNGFKEVVFRQGRQLRPVHIKENLVVGVEFWMLVE